MELRARALFKTNAQWSLSDFPRGTSQPSYTEKHHTALQHYAWAPLSTAKSPMKSIKIWKPWHYVDMERILVSNMKAATRRPCLTWAGSVHVQRLNMLPTCMSMNDREGATRTEFADTNDILMRRWIYKKWRSTAFPYLSGACAVQAKGFSPGSTHGCVGCTVHGIR